VRGAGRTAAVALLVLAALAGAGCGKASSPSPAELALEREDLVFVVRALQSVQGESSDEVAATRAAWPQIYAGLARRRTGLYTPQIRNAIETASRLDLPTLFEPRPAASLTGPASGLTGLYRAFSGLASRGWKMIGGAIFQIEHGTPPAARFARDNIALYIESIYDAHYGLTQIGKQLRAAYAKLGGEEVFGEALGQDEVDALASAYSEASDRLEPQVQVKLGT
jgi:hypothetical protein